MKRFHLRPTRGERPAWLFKALLLIGVFAAFWSGPGSALAGTGAYPCDSDRLGFGVLYGVNNYNLAPLHAGWYVNWGATAQASHPAGLDFAQMIRTNDAGYSPNGDALAAIVDQTPGALWLIGNEPDCAYQDNTTPANYARIYHDAYLAIKIRDPLAQIAIGGIVQATPLRMQWLNMVWDEYQARYGQPIPVDVWNVHAFVLREVRWGHGLECQPAGTTEGGDWGAGIPPGVTANCGQWIAIDGLDRMDLFAQQIVRFRTWMRDHGQQAKPLIVSEYGILFNKELGYDYGRVRDYLYATFNYFMSARDPATGYPADDYHLVQRWAWYSLDDTNFVWGTTYSALMDPQTRAIRPLGQDFASYASRQSCPAYVDLQPFTHLVSTPSPIQYGQPGTVRLQLAIRNQGNTAAAASQARFWEGNPDAGGALLGTVALSPVPARYQGMITATLDWPTVAQGSHLITAQVDALSQVAESREDNNRTTWTVDFGTMNLAVSPAAWQLIYGPLRPGEATQLSLGPAVVTTTQVSLPSHGITLLPPAGSAVWYDGDPASGGQVIADSPLPPAFNAVQAIPAQLWAPVITGVRTPRLVVRLGNNAVETRLDDNVAGLPIPAFTDLTLTKAWQVPPIPVRPSGGSADVAIRFRAQNIGTVAPPAPVKVSIWSGTIPTGAALGMVGLASNGDWTETWTWPGVGVGYYPLVGVINAEHLIPETVETNNRLAGGVMVAKTQYRLPVGRYR